MKILLLSDPYPPRLGGVEVMAKVLAQGLADRGHAVTVVASQDTDEGLPEHRQEGSVSVWRLPLQESFQASDPHLLVRILKKIASIKRDFQPDLVHVFTPAPGAYFHLRTHTASPDASTVLTLHGGTAELAANPGTLLGDLFARSAAITFVSEDLMSQVTRTFPELQGKAYVVHNAVVSASDEPAPGTNESAPTFFAAGRMSPEKGFCVLVEAFAGVLRRMPQARLTLAGTGPDETALRDAAASLQIAQRIDFPGWLDTVDLRSRMAQASIVVVPSRSETFGLVALEAALMQKPVVASNVGGLPEVVKDGVTGMLVPPGDALALADAMVHLAESPKTCERMGRAARAHALETFSIERMLDGYEQVYLRATEAAAKRVPQGEAA